MLTLLTKVSDFLFLAHRLGRLSVVQGSIDEMQAEHIKLQGGRTIASDVLVKCLGYHARDLSQIYGFEYRHTVFLNGKPNVAFQCDPGME